MCVYVNETKVYRVGPELHQAFGPLTSSGFVKGKRGDQNIVVTGSARKRIRSDPVIWCTSVTHQAAALADAYRSLSESVHRVKSYPRTQKKSLALALRPWRRILRRW